MREMLTQLGEEDIKVILSSFSCPVNKDVEIFLRERAIEFNIQGISATHLIFASYKGAQSLIGYFTLSNKSIEIPTRNLSDKFRKRLRRFAQNDNNKHLIQLAIPLIGQLGKNYLNDLNKLITGDELLKMALEQVHESQRILGGRFVYLECEDTPKLIQFYVDNGFVKFNDRPLDDDEVLVMKGTRLVQMLRYVKDGEYDQPYLNII